MILKSPCDFQSFCSNVRLPVSYRSKHIQISRQKKLFKDEILVANKIAYLTLRMICASYKYEKGGLVDPGLWVIETRRRDKYQNTGPTDEHSAFSTIQRVHHLFLINRYLLIRSKHFLFILKINA